MSYGRIRTIVRSFTHAVVSTPCLGYSYVCVCVCAFVHLRMLLFVLHNILIGCVADLSEFKCLMRSCAAAVAAAIAKRQTYEYILSHSPVEGLYCLIRRHTEFRKRIYQLRHIERPKQIEREKKTTQTDSHHPVYGVLTTFRI